jgi:hypothetical protein
MLVMFMTGQPSRKPSNNPTTKPLNIPLQCCHYVGRYQYP